MMNKQVVSRTTVFILVLMTVLSISAQVFVYSDETSLRIATIESRPLSNDRLLYNAFRQIGYRSTYSQEQLVSGYQMANNGDFDGVISATPDMEELYPNLVKVNVPFEITNICAYVRSDSSLKISDWSDLSGLGVCINSQRIFIRSQIPEDAVVFEKDTTNQMIQGLIDREYDVIIITQQAHETQKLPSRIIRAGIIEHLSEYLFLNKRHEYLREPLERKLNEMFANGMAERILDDLVVEELYQKKTILHLVSTNMEQPREVMLLSELTERFADDLSIEWYTLTLNSKRFSVDSTRFESFANLLRKDFVAKNVAAIVVSGDNAITFLESCYYLFFRGVPIVFYGVNGDYNQIVQDFAPYATGVGEVISAYETVSEALKLLPDTKRVFVVNDYMTDGRNYQQEIKRQLEPLANTVEITYSENITSSELLNQLSALTTGDIVLAGTYFTDSEGQYHPLNEMQRLIERDCNVPVFSFYSVNNDYNSVGGKTLDYQKLGGLIADILTRVFNGETPVNIPVIEDSELYSTWSFDKIKLDELNISEDQLPEGSTVLNKTPGIWEADPQLAAALCALFVLSIVVTIIITFLWSRYRRQRQLLEKDAAISEVNQRLERIINSAPVMFVLTIDGIVVEANDNVRMSTGLTVGEHIGQLYDDEKGTRNRFINQVKRQGFVTNEVIKVKYADGTIHRCLVNSIVTEYNSQAAMATWAVDIEQDELKKDQIRNARQTLQTIMDTLPIPVSIISAERMAVVYGNELYTQMLECESLDEMNKRDVNDVMLPQDKDITPEKLLEHMLSHDGLLVNDILTRSATGKVWDMRLLTRPIDYHGERSVIGIMTDLSKEKESERIRLSLQTVLDVLPVPLMIMNIEEDFIVYLNRAASDLFKLQSFGDIGNLPVKDFLAVDQHSDSITLEKLREIRREEKPSSFELISRKSDGETFDSLVTICRIDYKGKDLSLCIIKDLTAEKEYENMLSSAAIKEKEANFLKSRFLVNMSHEIRTPMNAIIGLTEIELLKQIPDTSRDIYTKINTSAKNLLDIINDILDLSKIEADKFQLYEEEFELEGVLNSALLVASPRLDGKNVEFMLNSALDLPRYIIGDKTRLWQILKNFLDNAAKYTDQGKIVLTVFTDYAHSDDETITLTFIIDDTGIGIAEDNLEKLFLPYEQVYSDAQKRYSGTGLGLPISKQLCEIMGGDLKVESRVGSGTTVHFSIPFKRSSNSETEQNAVEAPVLSGLNVLAVDDDTLSLNIMKRLLNGSNANCTTAVSGTEAIDIILARRNNGEYFDLILLDYLMDGLTGLETAKKIHMALSNAPKLLMVTAYQKMLLKTELEVSGIDDIIEKPFIPSQFIRKICTVLGFSGDTTYKNAPTFKLYKDAKVLLCEDYRLNQEVAVGMFTQFGVEAVIAANGRECLDILNSGEQFDIIFMDLQMPVMDGYEATRIIRADSRFDKLPIISLTADAMKEIVDECLAIGMNDHISKPMDFESLNRIFENWMPESKQLKPLEKSPEPVQDLSPDKEALARFGGNHELFNRALIEFGDDLPADWPDYESAIAAADATAKLVHKIKGAAGNLSLHEMYDNAVAFEASLKESAPDEELYRKLVRSVTTYKKLALEKFKSTAEKEEGTAVEYRKLMDRLQAALESYSPADSSEVLEALNSKQWPMTDEEQFEKLCKFTQNYEFDEALDVLFELRERG